MRMKIVEKISIGCLLLMVLASCDGNRTDDTIEIPVSEYGYIFFNTEVESRGALLEERLEDSFGVLGYTYDKDWETARPQATPNVFHKQLIEYKKVNNVYTHTYSPLQPWLGLQKYSFFAYYPFSEDLMAPSASTHEGNPYVVYTLASRTEVTDLVDVMTGQVFDTDASARTVDFTMSHRLTAIDIVARNFSDAVEVSAMKIMFNNLLYDKVKIPLNTNDEPGLVYDYDVAENQTATYTLVNAPIEIKPNEQKNITSDGKTMIVIPQNTPLEGSIDITFKNSSGTENTDTQEFKMNKETQAGRRYYMQLAFTQEKITIAIVESEEWADADNIYHEFE